MLQPTSYKWCSISVGVMLRLVMLNSMMRSFVIGIQSRSVVINQYRQTWMVVVLGMRCMNNNHSSHTEDIQSSNHNSNNNTNSCVHTIGRITTVFKNECEYILASRSLICLMIVWFLFAMCLAMMMQIQSVHYGDEGMANHHDTFNKTLQARDALLVWCYATACDVECCDVICCYRNAVTVCCH